MLVSLLVVLFQLVPSHTREAPSSGAGLAWEVPKGWESAPVPSPMRLATYRLPSAPGDPERPELGVFYFGSGQGGSVDANVARWLAQFEAEKGTKREAPEKLTVHGVAVTVVKVEGTYASGMPGGPTTPRSGWALLGAIAEGPEGAVFFKLTGPRKSVEKARAGFDALVVSLRKASSV
jgi:hypothetical protein